MTIILVRRVIRNYSFKHPAGWVLASSADGCVTGQVTMGTDQASAGQCRTANSGQMWLQTQSGNAALQYTLEQGCDNVTKTSVTVSGIQGTKEVGTGRNPSNKVGGFPNGGKVVRYVFYANKRTYVATYVQGPKYADVLPDFDLLVMKTLAFQ